LNLRGKLKCVNIFSTLKYKSELSAASYGLTAQSAMLSHKIMKFLDQWKLSWLAKNARKYSEKT